MIRYAACAGKALSWIDPHGFARVYQLPGVLQLACWSAGNLERDQYIPSSRHLGVGMRLKRPKKSIVEPLHQVPVCDCIDELHRDL
jgi:hypothetical protein